MDDRTVVVEAFELDKVGVTTAPAPHAPGPVTLPAVVDMVLVVAVAVDDVVADAVVVVAADIG